MRFANAPAIALLSLSIVGCPGTTQPPLPNAGAPKPSPVVDPGKMDEDLKVLANSGFLKRRFFTFAGGLAYVPENAVGRLLIVKKKNNTCPGPVADNYDAGFLDPTSYIKTDIKPTLTTPGNVLYSQKVDARASAALNFVSAVGNMDASKLAEVTITDVANATVPPEGFNPTWKTDILQRFTPDTCGIILVETATLTTVHVKNYSSIAADAKVSAGVFNAGGKYYAEEAGVHNDLVLSFTGFVTEPPANPPSRPNPAGVMVPVMSMDIWRDVARRVQTPELPRSIQVAAQDVRRIQ